MSELEAKVSEAKRLYYETYDKAFTVHQAYNRLKQRVHAEYFRVRLARRRVKARLQELSAEEGRLWKRCLRDKEGKSCVAQCLRRVSRQNAPSVSGEHRSSQTAAE